MTLYLDIFDKKFEKARQRLAGLAQQTEQGALPQDILTDTLDELANALEEVHVLSEELAEQHDYLQTAHVTIITERQQYFDLFDLAPEGYIVTNTQGIIEQINQTAVTLLARHQRLLIGKPLGALVAQADSQRFYTLLTRLQQGETFQNLDLCLHSYKRQSIHASFTIAPIRDHQSQLLGFRWLFRDLTQQRQAAIALEESEAQYRAIVEDQTELICRSLADARITFANQAFCYYFDRSPMHVMGTSFLDQVAEADREMVLQQLAALDRVNPVITLEHRVVLPGGELRWQSWVHRALFDDKGDFFQFQSAGRDITDQKQAEEDLRQREAQLRLVTDALPVLLAYINSKQEVVYANRTHEQWLGIPSTGIVGLYLWEALGPDAYRQIRFPVEEALSGEYVTFEQELMWPNQPPFWISATFVPDRTTAGHINGFFVLINDISDRKALEDQKDQLISIVSHELRIPLTSIHGALRLLTHGEVDPLSADGQDLLAVADRSAERMVCLIDDLLDLQQIKLGNVPLNPQVCQAADLIKSAIDTLQVMAQEHNITLKTAPCEVAVWADCDRIVQVLANLISNAIKFSPTGSTVWITAGKAVNANLPPSSPHVRFQVRDQGQGMPEENLERIFEAFHQLDVSDSRSRGGVGLGLAICRTIIEQHGGTMRVESTLDYGTTVSFTLPRKGYQP
ncbi:PAS domain-containing sensor histidine kinase [Leptothoe spongobia]|uniref:histidine kinase n=1 Tax=Leptothoe spongobia TAU-MAC 1115 TaxID=1967444 RepID=A0A947DEE8_9CYAN|nr:PAS domain-containing sensor histidine kinase [Leptothoe spongobia]MBT9315533.1 PAS domain-containing sensor histidine kinase [Leptothoe spongobia TAU-MAC 1115]